jgi:hypothetical protein
MHNSVPALFKSADNRAFAGTWCPGYDMPVGSSHGDVFVMQNIFDEFGFLRIHQINTGKKIGLPPIILDSSPI